MIILVLIAVAQLFGFFEKVSLIASRLALLPIVFAQLWIKVWGEVSVMNLVECILMYSRRMAIPSLRSNRFLLLPRIGTIWIKLH